MSADNHRFLFVLMQTLMENMTNNYGAENWDHERFGPFKAGFKQTAVSKLNQLLSGRYSITTGNKQPDPAGLEKLLASLDGFTYLHDLLADEHSKATLVQVVAYRLLGPGKFRLPLNTSSYWSKRREMQSLVKGPDTLDVKWSQVKLQHLSLEKIGYPMDLYYVPSSVVGTFVLRQYEYGKTAHKIGVNAGDYVIDAGGCWGDTALYFANETGNNGHVFTFEFTPDNLTVMQRNFDLNPSLKERITLNQRALWHRSGETIDCFPNGPGTSLDQSRHDNSRREDGMKVETVSLDDFVCEHNLPRVDFIKMDIEGAELEALRGAENSVRRWKPRLAISLYHNETDLIEIPRYLNELNIGYEFYLDHFTIYEEETVLFARPRG